MPIKILRKNLKKITLIAACFLFIFTAHALAANKVVNKKQDNLAATLQQEARLYRNEGLSYQNSGDLDSALKFYQKALEFDPGYAVVYNDLGVIYESQGELGQAEESYLKSIKSDPNYVSAYSNLALLYEDKRELAKAAYFWDKRVELGNPDDLWTLKARKRLEDINLSLSGQRVKKIEEKDINALMKDVISKKATLSQSSKQAAAQKPQNIKLDSPEKGYSAEMQKALEEAQKLDSKKKDTK